MPYYTITTTVVSVPDHMSRDTGFPGNPKGDLRTGFTDNLIAAKRLAALDKANGGCPQIEKWAECVNSPVRQEEPETMSTTQQSRSVEIKLTGKTIRVRGKLVSEWGVYDAATGKLLSVRDSQQEAEEIAEAHKAGLMK